MLPRIFDLFTQVDRSLDRSQGGLGIGLTLVRRLVEMHGGRVQAHSEGPNRGSEFVVRLPASIDAIDDGSRGRPTVLARRRGAAPADPDRRGLSRRGAETLRKLLRLGGHEVRVARDGPGALEELAAADAEIVLLDIGLPGMDGYEVARLIRKRPGGESIVLVALTGYGQDDDRRRSIEAGFDHHLTKPVDPAALFSLISSIGRKDHRPVAMNAVLASA